MIQKVTNQPFQVLASNFSIGPSNEGYTLQISADGSNYSNLFTVGPNTTRMVTGVANGSFYRLLGNETEVAINWRTQCNDGGSGGGGTYVLPPATENTLGGIKVGDGLNIDSAGTLSASGGSVPDMNILRSVDEFPESANTGDVVALAEEITYTCTDWQEDEEVPNQYNTGLDFLGWGIENVIANHPFTTLTFPIDNSGNNIYVKFEYSDVGGYYMVITSDDGSNEDVVYLSDVEVYHTYVATTSINEDTYFVNITLKNIEGSYILTLFAQVEDQSEYCAYDFTFNNDLTYIDTGLYQYDGEDWSRIGEGGGDEPASQDFIHLDSLSEVGETGKTYEYKQRLFKWVDGAGKWGRWIVSPNPDEGEIQNIDSWLIYSYLPNSVSTSITLTQIKVISVFYTANLEDGVINIYNSNSQLVNTVSLGSATTITGSGRSMTITWTEGKIRFRCNNGFAEIRNTCSTSESNSHYECYEVDEFRNKNNQGTNWGMPWYDSDGTIIGSKYRPAISNKKLNNTGYTNTIAIFTNGQHSNWQSWFIPTQPGTAGQILQSNGNAEPTWVSMVKIAKVTSAEYEALVSGGTVDSNTLYLIDDGNA